MDAEYPAPCNVDAIEDAALSEHDWTGADTPAPISHSYFGVGRPELQQIILRFSFPADSITKSVAQRSIRGDLRVHGCATKPESLLLTSAHSKLLRPGWQMRPAFDSATLWS